MVMFSTDDSKAGVHFTSCCLRYYVVIYILRESVGKVLQFGGNNATKYTDVQLMKNSWAHSDILLIFVCAFVFTGGFETKNGGEFRRIRCER